MTKVVEIFIAYSRKDSEYLDELRTHLAPLERSHRVKVWYDGKIDPGAVWEEAIKKHLHSSDIILLLVSADAIASDYFYDKELSDALKRHRAGEASVVPLIVRPCAWRATPLADLQAIPQNGRPVTDWLVRDNAYADAVESLWKMIDRVHEGRREQAESEHQRLTDAETARVAAKHKGQEEARRQREAKEEQQRLETERLRREAAERRTKVEGYKAEAKRNLNRRDWPRAFTAAQAALQIDPDDAEARKIFEQTQQPTKDLPEPPQPPYLKWGAIAAGLALVVFILLKMINGGAIEKDHAAQIEKLESEMASITAGTFTMGCKNAKRDGDCSDDEKPPHEVHVRDFFIGYYEVTQVQWRAVMGSDPPELHNKGCDECPVEGVSWNDIKEFLKKLNTLTGKQYRLPTEAEWEYAARGGAQSRGYLYSGSNTIDEVAWYYENYAKGNNTFGEQKTTRPVGGKKPNELGLYDMTGNAWEWVADCWHENYEEAPKDGTAWLEANGGNCSGRVVRGGSWLDFDDYCRVSSRFSYNADLRYFIIGFRLARY